MLSYDDSAPAHHHILSLAVKRNALCRRPGRYTRFMLALAVDRDSNAYSMLPAATWCVIGQLTSLSV